MRRGPVLGPQRDVVQHMRALPHREVAAAIQTARASTVPLAVRLAFEFLVLTAARWGEVRWAEWTEVDRDEGVWTVPARRTKANREHRVPLCGRALEILDEARKLVEGTSPYLFPNRVGEQLEEKQLICPPKTRPSPVLESGRGQDTKGEGTMAAPKRLSPAQIINRLRKAEVALANGNTTKEVCRELGVSEQTYYRWRREYGGMKLSQAKRLKEFEKENQQLKRAVAELTLDKLILKEASEGNF